MIKSSAYYTNMQIVKVLDKSYKYFNHFSGELSDEFYSTIVTGKQIGRAHV